jgi:hypothetical protein
LTHSRPGANISWMKVSGVIQAAPANVGSKSERTGFRIALSDGQSFRLYKAGDNPFVNATLVPLDGQEVEVAGEWDGDLFVVTEIRKLP